MITDSNSAGRYYRLSVLIQHTRPINYLISAVMAKTSVVICPALRYWSIRADTASRSPFFRCRSYSRNTPSVIQLAFWNSGRLSSRYLAPAHPYCLGQSPDAEARLNSQRIRTVLIASRVKKGRVALNNSSRQRVNTPNIISGSSSPPGSAPAWKWADLHF